MSSLHVSGDGTRAVVLPDAPDPDWAATAAEQVRTAHEWPDDGGARQILEAISQEPGPGAWLVLVDAEARAFCPMRVMLVNEAISEQRQRELLDPPAHVLPSRRRVSITPLGRGTRAAVVQQDPGAGPRSSIRWVFARPRQALVALAGPGDPAVVGRLLPVAEAVLEAVEVKADEPFAEGEDVSIVIEDPAVEAWDL